MWNKRIKLNCKNWKKQDKVKLLKIKKVDGLAQYAVLSFV